MRPKARPETQGWLRRNTYSMLAAERQARTLPGASATVCAESRRAPASGTEMTGKAGDLGCGAGRMHVLKRKSVRLAEALGEELRT